MVTDRHVTPHLFDRLKSADRSLVAAWCSLGSPFVVELAGEAGFGAVVIDYQHGVAGKAELIACMMAARGCGLPGLVRIGANEAWQIGEAFDLGAEGVICPMVNSASDVRKLVEAAYFPPLGQRSFGPYGAKYGVDGDYFEVANDLVVPCAQIETKQALDNLDEILAVDGLKMILVGPNDLAISLSDGRSRDINGVAVQEALDHILARSREKNVIAGVFANDLEYAVPLVEKGWDFVVAGTEASLLGKAFSDVVERLDAGS